MANLRICSKCGVLKPITSFHHKLTGKDGRNIQCNTCINSKYGQHVNPLFSRVLGRKL